MAGDEVRELLERVTAATGPDMALDAAIEVALFQPRDYSPECRLAPSGRGRVVTTYVYRGDGHRSYGTSRASRVTASIDAALALVERVKPGWSWGVSGATKPRCDALLYEPTPGGFKRKIKADGATPPLAILAALLTALQQDAETTQAGEGR